MRQNRGTLTKPGVNSPYRDRSVEENLDLFARMRAGEFPDGSRVLRAKIDMASPNVLMRDPTLYRILRCHHHRTGDAWCIYPMYDFQHPLQDAIEGITHSLCSLEYEIHRPLYDWVVREAGFAHPPRQIEFARLNLTRTVMSKRHLRRFVEEGVVAGWDDPRMPTLAAMRRRGYTAAAVKDFLGRVGVAKADSTVDLALLEHCVRENLGDTAPRAMAVLRPLKVTLSNWPEGFVDEITMENHPDHPEMGERTLHMGNVIYIDREDFMEEPPKKFFRLAPGREVRLKGAYIIRCEEVIHDANGEVSELDLLCGYGQPLRQRGREPQGQGYAALAERAGRLALRSAPLRADSAGRCGRAGRDGRGRRRGGGGFLRRLHGARQPQQPDGGARPLRAVRRRCGYGRGIPVFAHGLFLQDPDSTAELPVYNRTVSLKDSWAKAKEK